MSRKYFKNTGGLPASNFIHEGVNTDGKALNPSQLDCIQLLRKTTQLEQEEYLINHPEILTLLKMFISKLGPDENEDILRKAVLYFTRQDLDGPLRKILNVSPGGSYMRKIPASLGIDEFKLKTEFQNILKKYNTPVVDRPSSEIEVVPTVSSSFISVVTSASTVKTPEPISTPDLTISEIFYNAIVATIDKATLSPLSDYDIKYDTAYVELSKAVEAAMEVPVKEIREYIAQLFTTAYEMFENEIIEKERKVAEIAWENRIRKKLKRLLRRQKNFKGFETPSTPRSRSSAHSSDKTAPLQPCECTYTWSYNRYPKDRFGIYLPRNEVYEETSVTVCPMTQNDDEIDHTAIENKNLKRLTNKQSDD